MRQVFNCQFDRMGRRVSQRSSGNFEEIIFVFSKNLIPADKWIQIIEAKIESEIGIHFIYILL